MNKDMETRALTVEMAPNESGEFIGYPVVWDQWSLDLGGFIESFAPRAFGDNPTTEHDVRALFNHDPNKVMGRTTAGTLVLENDEHGLKMRVSPPDHQWVRELRESVKRGDINQGSFLFRVHVPHEDDEWTKRDDGIIQRVVKKASISDVSIVTFPAYPQTSVSVRSVIDDIKAQEGHDEDLVDQAPDGEVERPDYSLHKKLLEIL